MFDINKNIKMLAIDIKKDIAKRAREIEELECLLYQNNLKDVSLGDEESYYRHNPSDENKCKIKEIELESIKLKESILEIECELKLKYKELDNLIKKN